MGGVAQGLKYEDWSNVFWIETVVDRVVYVYPPLKKEKVEAAVNKKNNERKSRGRSLRRPRK